MDIALAIGYLFVVGIYAGMVYNNTDAEEFISIFEGLFWPICLPVRFGWYFVDRFNFDLSLKLLNKTIHKTKQLIKNNMKKLLGLSTVFLLFGMFAWGISAYVTYSNQWANLSAQYEAQDKVDQVIHDEVWKTIQQEANVSDRYAEQFNKIYVEVMDARYKDGAGQLMQWITEQNPNFTPELYGRLMNTIEAKRAEFTNNQKKLIAIHAELVKLTTTIPSSWFLGGKTLKEPRLVTSTRTGEAFSTGKDDDTSLYPSDSSK